MPTEVTGVDLLRQAVKARMHKPNIANMAREVGVPMVQLEAFSNGTITFAPEVLVTLTPYLFPMAQYDPAINKLRPAVTAPSMTMAAYPPKFVPGKVPMEGGLNLGQPKRPSLAQRLGWAK